MGSKRTLFFFSILLLILSLQPCYISASCTCESEEPASTSNNNKQALVYKLVGIGTILISGAVGVCIPTLGRRFIPSLNPDRSIFFIIKAFAGGVLLTTAMVHILPDAYNDLTSPCLPEKPWGDFPFTGFIAVMSSILTLIAESLAMSYYRKSRKINNQTDQTELRSMDVETGHPHPHASLTVSSSDDTLLRHRVICQVLELGVVVHSLIIGLAVGVSHRASTIRPLIAAISFHQFFEGVGLGGSVSAAQFRTKTVSMMIIFFSITTPLGIGIGIGVGKAYNELSPTTHIVQGVMNSASAGILIYMALVDLLAEQFMDPKLQNGWKIQVASYVALLLGAGCMSLLAVWA